MYSRLYLIVILAFTSMVVYGQSKEIKDYDDYIESSKVGGITNIRKLANSSNVKFNIIISYFIDANNSMFKKTHNQKYLDFNLEVVKVICNQDERVAEFYTHEGNNELNGEQSILFEGYLNRYLAEFCVLLTESGYNNEGELLLNYLEDRFKYWVNMSLLKTGDLSFLYGVRIHMGAQWASTALHLSILTKDNDMNRVYNNYIETFDSILLSQIKIVNGIATWNSTYDDLFTNSLKKRGKESEIQDTSHGNHVVQYILDRCDYSNNRKFVELKLAVVATFLNKIISSSKIVNQQVDGKFPSESLGYLCKLSDGWMKLGLIDKDISIFWSNLKEGEIFVNYNSYNQFLANIINYEG